MANQPELILDARAALGEGAIWHSRRGVLHWVDILGHTVRTFDPAANRHWAVDVGETVGTVVPTRGERLLVALQRVFALLDPEQGVAERFPEQPVEAEDNRFNDGKCDPTGRLWVGGISLRGRKEVSELVCLHPDRSVTRHVGAITCSNGLAWSHDHALFYYIDTPTRRIDVFDYDAGSGRISGRRPLFVFPEGTGYPDGMTIDRDGRLWVAMWEGWKVLCVDPAAGKIVDEVPVPAARVTSCAFGGPELADLYITTARVGLEGAALERQPLAGGLFRVRPGVRGVAAFEWAG